ncbi:MAG: glycosyl hydrolase, partial [Candidatus Acidoferrum typicum]|nr:glycosyl hydrolase [Candidatus Acidoferrum typicum]
GKLVAVARSPLEASRHSAEPAHLSRLNWRTRWLAPALGIAAVLAIWFAMRPPRRPADQNPAGNLIAQAPTSEPAPSMEAPTKQQSAEATVNPKRNSEAPTDRDHSANPSTDSLAKKSLDAGGAREIAPNSNTAESGLHDEKRQKAESNEIGIGSPTGVGGALSTPAPAARAAAPLPAAPPSPQAQAKTQASADAVQPRSTTQSVTVTGEAPPVQTTNGTLSGSLNESKAKDLPLNGRNYQSMAKLDAQGEFPVQLKTPSAKILWRAGKGGNIQRSSDAGGTWTSQASPLQEDWLAGAPVSDTACWIVGRNGAIARTTDGSHWEKIAPPPMATDVSGKLPDWIGIVAVDPKTATITASDLHRFATRDAGKTWKAQ